MTSVRERLGKLILDGRDGRALDVLFEEAAQHFRKNGESLLLDTFVSWYLGKVFPGTRRRQDLLADVVGGSCGHEIRCLKAPPFRSVRKVKGQNMPRKLREFEEIMREHGDRLVPQARIVCSECNRKHHHPRHGIYGKNEDEEYFKRKGWEVGRTPDRDRCKECVEKSKTKKVINMSDHKRQTELDSTPPAVQAAPSEMSKKDKQDIFAAIYSNWNRELDRYNSGWSDTKIAEAQEKPVEWVKAVREDAFGGEGEDPDLFKILESMLMLQNDTQRQAQTIAVDSDSLADLQKTFNQQTADFQILLEKATRHNKKNKEANGTIGEKLESYIALIQNILPRNIPVTKSKVS